MLIITLNLKQHTTEVIGPTVHMPY